MDLSQRRLLHAQVSLCHCVHGLSFGLMRRCLSRSRLHVTVDQEPEFVSRLILKGRVVCCVKSV